MRSTYVYSICNVVSVTKCCRSGRRNAVFKLVQVVDDASRCLANLCLPALSTRCALKHTSGCGAFTAAVFVFGGEIAMVVGGDLG